LAIAMRATLIAAMAATLLAAPASAATSAADAEAMIISWINKDRSAAGLAPFRSDADLATIAGIRAQRMASANVMNHSVGGNLSAQLNWFDVTWYRYGENVGWSTYAWTVEAAQNIYKGWKASPPHKKLLMSTRFNYIGLGLAYRSSNKRTYASAVMAETNDHTNAYAKINRTSRSGDDIRWEWSGYDPRLQTHTAGLRDFDVQYRVGSGSWATLRNDSKYGTLDLKNRTGGRYYGIRVRATDRRGNVGPWTPESRIWVP
jgi:uncharacterized protein YkwD